YVLTTDVKPQITSISKTSNVELLKEVDTLYYTDITNKGYYYKPSSINAIYYYKDLSVPYMDGGVVLEEYEGAYNRSPLQYLYYWYTNTSHSENPSTSTNQLLTISSKWVTGVTYQKPYTEATAWDSSTQYYYDSVVSNNSKTYRCIVATATSGTFESSEWVEVNLNWGVYEFEVGGTIASMGTNYDGKYIKVDSDHIISNEIIVNNIYPAFDGENLTNTYFYIPAMYYNSFEDNGVIGTNYYVFKLDSNNRHIFISLDTDYKLETLFPNAKNTVSNFGTVHIYFLPKLYRFNDFVRYTYKTYYQPKELYNRNCGEIKAWTCTALENDYIRDNPMKNIGDLWSTLQTNTSLTLIENEIKSFAAGDILIFDAAESSESYVTWPTFSNTETVLDLDAYEVLYQRVGEDIKPLDTVAVDDYKWRGYSSLMLNTASTSGQKLEYNHTLTLYDTDLGINPIATLYGNSENNITFQLKYPVENQSGTFIDVSSVDILGENLLNTLYAFTPFLNGTYYAYDTNNYKTYLYFNSDEVEGVGGSTYSPQEITLPIGLPKGNYMLGMNMK
ncbi:MAG: hypothetical protein IJH55_00685, partial [Romboutsia sp.]|nr:hypothetical protein [Romboutsia sp.]